MPRKKNVEDAEQQSYPGRGNARYIEFLTAITPDKPLDHRDVEEMKRRFNHYLKVCGEFDMKVGNLNAYYAIGISRQLAAVWVHDTKPQNAERQEFIERVQQICGGYREILMQDGKVNPVTGIFWQKNFDGFRDQQEVITTQVSLLGDAPDLEKLQKKYLDNSHFEALPEKSQKEE